ncbi:unnamed protein product, partial [Medioppia subpectinata]
IKYPHLKYIDCNQYDIQWKTHLLPIIKSQSVFVAYESLINEIIYLYPTLPLHKSNENLMLAIGGVLVRKQFNPWIKYRFKHIIKIFVYHNERDGTIIVANEVKKKHNCSPYLCLTNTGTAHIWGSNDSQQLGPLVVRVDGQPYRSQLYKNGRRYRHAICGPDHTVLITTTGVIQVCGLQRWSPVAKNGHLFGIVIVSPETQFKRIDTTYSNRVVIATAMDGQHFIVGTDNGLHIFTPIDIPMGCSLFDVYADYCGFKRTFNSIVDLIRDAISLSDTTTAVVTESIGSHSYYHLKPESNVDIIVESDEEIYLSDPEEVEDKETNRLQTQSLMSSNLSHFGPHIDYECHKSGSVLPDGPSLVLISDSIDPKSTKNAMNLRLTECGDNAGTVDSISSIDPNIDFQNHLLANKESIQSMNNCSESDEEVYMSDTEGEGLYNTGTISDKSTTCCDPIVKQHLLKAFNNRLDFDLRFIVENKVIYCHKTVLKIRNKEFWRICEQNMFNERDIEINAYSYDTIKAFLMFLYGLRPEVNDQNCQQLLGLAEDYGERGLKNMYLKSNQLLVERIGAIGALKVTVSSGKKSLTISNVYGLGAGAVADINGGKNGRKNVDEKQEVKTITEPLYKKYMNSLSTKDSSAGLLVLAEGGNAGEAVIATREGHLDVKGASGFKLGSYTEISARG